MRGGLALLGSLALAIALLVAGCSGGESGSSGGAGGGAGGAAATGSVVKIQGNLFVPELLQVMKGTTVTWVNEDSVDHQVSHSDFESPVLKPGSSWSYTFNSVFTFEYTCKLHPVSKGAIAVRSVPVKQ